MDEYDEEILDFLRLYKPPMPEYSGGRLFLFWELNFYLFAFKG